MQENSIRFLFLVLLVCIAVWSGCDRAGESDENEKEGDIDDDSSSDSDDSDDDDDNNDDNDDDDQIFADVFAVNTSGEQGAYSFSVTVSSPDTGCDQYADWWEVLSTSGDLIYRRILNHSHVNEQPFTREGGPVSIQLSDTVIVRAHMNTSGYGGMAMRGSVNGTFVQAPDITADFASEVEDEEPLPEDCLF